MHSMLFQAKDIEIMFISLPSGNHMLVLAAERC